MFVYFSLSFFCKTIVKYTANLPKKIDKMSDFRWFCRNVLSRFMVNPVDECRKMWYSLYIPKRGKQNTKESFKSLKNKPSKYSTHKSQDTKDIHFVEYFTEDKKDSFINETVFYLCKNQSLCHFISGKSNKWYNKRPSSRSCQGVFCLNTKIIYL